MYIIKPGLPQRNGEFNFSCKSCGCKWNANRGDNGLYFSPPCMEFYVFMECPNCKREVVAEENK